MHHTMGTGMRLAKWLGTKSKTTLLLGAIFGSGALAVFVITAEALVRARLDDDLLAAPTRYYARPVAFYSGARLDRDRVEGSLRRLGYTRVRTRDVEIGEYYGSSSGWIIGRRAFRQYDRLNPGGVITVRVGWDGQVTSVGDAGRRRIRLASLEPELIATRTASNEDRIPVPLASIPERLIEAVLSIEDRRFYRHEGLDLKRVMGATVANLRARRVVQGGSTLTQQLVKNLFLTPRRSATRKLRDMAMAVALEGRHTKAEILEAYLNQVYLGQDGALAIHGVGRASQFYFGKDVTQLDISEAALLAGMIRGPSLYSPFRHPEAATKRRNVVLNVMRDRGLLTEDTHRRAVAAPLRLRKQPERTRVGRYFVDFVASELRAAHGRDAIRTGTSVFTTLDFDLQQQAEAAVRGGLERLERDYARLRNGDAKLQAALVALDPRTGELLAMVGGREYGVSQFNRAARAQRQPGSAFKPIVALAALSQRGGYTLATTLHDEPLSVETPMGDWEPVNYDRQFRGDVSLRDALERSLNVPFARLGMDVGPERIVETARSLGFHSRLNPVPSLALGSSEVTPLELTRGFGVLAAGGFRADFHSTLSVLDGDGEVLDGFNWGGEQVFTPAETYLVTSALRGVVENGTGRALRQSGFRGAVAAKSGTTNDFRDAWFVGYTPTMVIGVWVGFDDGRGTGLTGSSAALPIFSRFLVNAVGRNGDGDFPVPSGVELARLADESWRRGCSGKTEVFLTGTAPRTSCAPYRSNYRRNRSYRSRRDRSVAPLPVPPTRRRGRRGYQ